MTPVISSFVDVPLFELRNFDEVEPEARSVVIEAERLLRSGLVQPEWGEQLVSETVERGGALAELEHELSPYYVERNAQFGLLEGRTMLERQITAELVTRCGPLDDMKPAHALHLMRQIIGQLQAGSWRTGFVHCLPDRAGCSARFPRVSDIRERLKAIFECVSSNRKDHPVFAATLALTGLSGLHPLTDGNGRLSRVIFNAVIQGEYESRFYLPLYELSNLSNGGYIISIRSAQYNNRWEDICNFILNSLRLFCPSDT